MKYRKYAAKLASLTYCLAALSTPAYATHSSDSHFPWPMMLDPENPLSSLTLSVTSNSAAQAYPSFSDPLQENGVNGTRFRNGSKYGVFLGMNVWKGATVIANADLMYGYNISDNISVANLLNVATARVGSSSPYLRLQRLFLQQEINLGTDETNIETEGARNTALENLQNTLRSKGSTNRITVTIGKFGVGDIFDDNIYAHDPSIHFMNLVFNTIGSIDFAGDPWGLSYGAAIEWTHNQWSARAGIFQGGKPAPSLNIDSIPLNQYMAIGELELRHDAFFNQPGSIKLLGYQDNGYINNIGDISSSNGNLPVFVRNQLRRTKLGAGINIQQQLFPNVGFFMRAGVDNGSFDYRDVTKNISAGLVLSGKLWNRDKDEFGIGAAYSGMKGTFGLLENNTFGYVGDLSRNYAPEKNIEAYYRWNVWKSYDLTFDYQFITNPGYVKNRGPAHVFGLRLRSTF